MFAICILLIKTDRAIVCAYKGGYLIACKLR